MYPVQMQRPSGVTILSILYALEGIAWLAGGAIAAWALAAFAGFGLGGIFAICFGVGVIIALICFVIAWGLWTMQGWARWVAIIFAVFSLISVPIGTIIGIIILLYLFQPEVKAAFGEAPAPVYGAPYVPYAPPGYAPPGYAPPGYPPQYPPQQQPGYPPQQPGYAPQQPGYAPPQQAPPAAAPPAGGKCPNCGATVNPGVAFCPNCGSRIG